MVRIKQLVIKHARGHPHSARFVLPSAWAFGGVSFYICCLTSHPLPLTLILIFPCPLVCEVVGITPIPQSRPLQSHCPRDRKPWCWRGPGDVDWAARGVRPGPQQAGGWQERFPGVRPLAKQLLTASVSGPEPHSSPHLVGSLVHGGTREGGPVGL